MVYSVTYKTSDDDSIGTILDQVSDACIFEFSGLYLIATNYAEIGIRRRLLPFLNNEDKLVITQLCKNGSCGKLSKQAKAFIKSYAEDHYINFPKVTSEGGDLGANHTPC